MKLETLEDCVTYFNSYRELNKRAKNLNYSISAKKGVVNVLEESWESGNGFSLRMCAQAIGVTQATLRTWKAQASLGLYDDTDGGTHVSRAVKESHCGSLAALEEEKKRIEDEAKLKLAQLAAQIAAIKTLESNGFTISRA